MMPDSRERAYWDLLNLMLMTWTIFEIPFSMLFADSKKACPWDGVMTTNLLVDLLFLFDIVLTFNTAYYDHEGILIGNMNKKTKF
jgi:hypothetical protein